ncbi:MAG TPA: 30S ribosome-binding factor RbfA [Candidatus Eisenbacteria bacterium]|nr:30S ribosome-binding factor RbfA [Candidatus Eisenbacteria bacterium]
MEYQRSERLAELLLELLSEMLRRELGDPRIGPVTLTGAKVSKDLRHARIYFNLLGGTGDRQAALAGLRSATGLMRAKLAKQLKLKFVPAIEFIYDETQDEARRIDELLRRTKG